MPSICNFHHSHRSIRIECFYLFDTVDYGKLISWIDYYCLCVCTMEWGFLTIYSYQKVGRFWGDPCCVYLSFNRVVCRLVYWSSLTTSQLHHRKISHPGVTVVRAFKHFQFPHLCWLSECNKGTACSSILPLSVADVALRAVSEIISTTYCLIINRGEECGFKGNFRFLCNLSYTGILHKLNV